MLKRFTVLLTYQPKNLYEVSLLKSLRRKQIQQGIAEENIDDDRLAEEAGLTGITNVSIEEVKEKKEELMRLLQSQKERRIVKHEAFLIWQASQREKGSAQRLLGQASRAERQKRNHYNSLEGRVLDVTCQKEKCDNIEQNVECETEHNKHHQLPKKAALSMTDFLVPSREQSKKFTVHLSLRNK